MKSTRLQGCSCTRWTKTPKLVLVKALDILFVLHAEHELNCSTAALRHLASSGVDVYLAISSACDALYGPQHGGATEAVVRMLIVIQETMSADALTAKQAITYGAYFVDQVKTKKQLGFGH